MLLTQGPTVTPQNIAGVSVRPTRPPCLQMPESSQGFCILQPTLDLSQEDVGQKPGFRSLWSSTEGREGGAGLG